jgi:hypothetical protein
MHPVDVGNAALPAMFDPATPNRPMLDAVLAGRLPGRAIADDPDEPTVAAVQTAEGIAFVSRTTSQDAFDAALTTLRDDSMVGVVWTGAEDGPITPETPARVVKRLGFDPIAPSSETLARLRADLPADVVDRSIDAELLARCEWSELVEGAHGSAEAFLEHGLGICLVRHDEILAEAYAPFIGRDVAEVGVITPEAHRGRGYAPIAVAFLATALAERGLAMYWSCDADNIASVRVADKVGFGPARPFRLLLYRPLTVQAGR